MNSTSVEIRLPKLGESIVSATVVQWMKQEGEWVEEDEPLLEVATDKVNSEIPSPSKGRLIKILATVDQEIEVGGALALLETSADAAQASEMPFHRESPHPPPAISGFLSPAVLHLVREQGIPLQELESITGSGEGGRITKRDVEAYVVARGQRNISKPTPRSPAEGVEVLPMSPMRKAIADNMARSFYSAPHAYILNEVDVTDLMQRVRQEREAFAATQGVKLTITSYLIRALTATIQDYPLLNASIDGDSILLKQDINVGVAVAVEQGLVVPVIKGCQNRDLASIAQALTDLSTRARSRQLQPEEVMGGSITLTNFGMSGALMGLPIIRHPEVAILGIGAIQKKVAVDKQDQVVVRQVLYATLSFDHRVVDGMYAGAFLHSLTEKLERND